MSNSPTQSKPDKSKKPRPRASARSGSRFAVCFVCVTAAFLLLVSLGSYWWHYEHQVDCQAGHTKMLNAIIAVDCFFAALLVLLTAMMHLTGITGGLKVWIPSLLAMISSALIASLLLNPNRPNLAPRSDAAVQPFIDIRESSKHQ